MSISTEAELIEMPTLQSFIHFNEIDSIVDHIPFLKAICREEDKIYLDGGWIFEPSKVVEHGAIFTNCVVGPNGEKVFVVNESQYAISGDYDLTIFAEKEEWLEDFLVDVFFYSDEEIEKLFGKSFKDRAVIKQTL
jgi:hypothetical protein